MERRRSASEGTSFAAPVKSASRFGYRPAERLSHRQGTMTSESPPLYYECEVCAYSTYDPRRAVEHEWAFSHRVNQKRPPEMSAHFAHVVA